MEKNMIKMSPQRLDALADGMFAIIMTILVFELHVPTLVGKATDKEIWHELAVQWPALLSFVLSFAVLFTYWRAHHYIMGIYAQTVDKHLMNINALFFFFVAVIPFSADLLGSFGANQVAVIFFATNIVLISMSLWFMRNYVLESNNVESISISKREKRHGTIRTLTPVVLSIASIIISVWHVPSALIILGIALVFNLIPKSTHFVDRFFGIDPMT